MSNPTIETFFDKATFSFTHLIYSTESRQAIVIDPVLDFDSAAMRISTESAEKLLDTIREKSLSLIWILETHVHC